MKNLGQLRKLRMIEDAALAVFERGAVRVEAVRDGVLRVRVGKSVAFARRESAQMEPDAKFGGKVKISGRTASAGGLSIRFRDQGFTVFGKKGRVLATGEFLLGDDKAGCRMAMKPDSRFYGFGEKAGKLEKRGTRMTMWNTDIFGAGIAKELDPYSTHPDPLYAAVPFFIEHRHGLCGGFFLDTGRRTDFDLGLDDGETVGFSMRENELDLYVIDGPEIGDVVRNYTALTGRIRMPPLWALGFHQCRWSYKTEKEVRAIAKKMRAAGVPCDALWLDIDYMDGFRIFTFNKERFPRPRKLTDDLRAQGFRTVAIVDPGLKADPQWSVYREGVRKGYFIKHKGQVYRGRVWPGDTVFPDFRKPEAARWFGRLGVEFADLYGLDGLWFDMNEPSDQNGQWHGPAHEACGNLYAHLELAGAAAEWDQARPNQRRFFLTRSASSGSQRYSAIWTGDNLSKFDHIGMSLAMSANLGLSGFPFVGSDVGGFGGNCDGELLARWTQYGSMTPFFRNHACAGTPDQEPWAFGPEVLRICRTYVRLRYRLLPYLYSLFRRAAEDGTPIQQPMIYAFPQDERFINEHRQFMLGEHLLVAPVIERGATRKRIVLPEGKWIDFHTGQALEGGKTVSHPAPLDVMPILVRAGAPLPLWPAAENTEKINRHLLRVECFPGQAAATRLYEDDGETRECENGAFAEIRLATRETDKERVLVRGRTQGAYRVPARKIEAVFVGCERKPKAAFLCDAKGEVKLPFKRGTTSRGEYLVAVPDDEAGFELALRF